MSKIIKKIFGALVEKPWDENQVNIDNQHVGSTFKGVSSYVSAVIVIFGVSTVLFSLIVTAYLYSCLLYTSPSPRDVEECRMPSSA